MIETLRKLYALLTPPERRRGAFVFSLTIVMAVFEVIGVASIFPFFMALSDTSLIQSNQYFAALYAWGEFTQDSSFLLALAFATFALLITGAIVRSLGEYAVTHFVQMRRHSLGSRLIERYLHQPYHFFLGRHTGEMAKNILAEVEQVTMFALSSVLRFSTSMVTLLAMLMFLVVLDPLIALVAMAVLTTAYVAIFLTIRRIISRNSALRVAADARRYTIAREALGGIKDIRMLAKEDTYIAHFSAPSIIVSRTQAANLVLGQVPKYLIEAIGFGGILLLCVMLLSTGSGMANGAQNGALNAGAILPKLGVYAFVGYRLLPSVQGIYRAVVELRYGASAVDVLYTEMTDLPVHISQNCAAKPMGLHRELRLENVSFSYADETRGIDRLSLSIPAGSSIGIVGTTGAGKTTLVDVLLGLLSPQAGRLLVDDQPIDEANVKNWQASIGYVPQTIFLADMSISENIALGTPRSQIDLEKIKDCARKAQLDRFITAELPEGYDTHIGEGGIRLSGGQRQRIGIARALYQDPDILVFDEATSALDSLTERDVMKAIEALHSTKTIVMIAHRLSTIQSCDQIVQLHEGRVNAIGSYAELMDQSRGFRALAGAGARS